VGLPTRFIELAGEVNRSMPDYVVQRVNLALNDRGKSVKGSRVLVLGLPTKPDVDDVRESPSFELIEKLQALGAHVDYNDPTSRQPQDAPLRSANAQRPALHPIRSPPTTAVLDFHPPQRLRLQQIADHARLIRRHAQRPAKCNRPRDHIVPA